MKKISILLFTMIIFLAGCTTSTDTTAQDTEFTNTDDLGREVTYIPERIYADSYVGELMYMDANLVGTDLTYQSASWPEDKVSELTDTGGDMEAVAALKPTLIITFYEDLVDQYSAIAPTYYIEYGKEDPVEIMPRLGELLGLEDTVADIVDEFNTRISDITKLIDQKDLTYTIVESGDDSIYLMGDNWARGGFILYKYLEMAGSELGESSYIHTDPTYTTVDSETLLSYDSDVIILVSEQPESSLFKTSPTYSELTAVKNDNVYEMSTDFAWYDDPYAVSMQLDFFEELFAGEL